MDEVFVDVRYAPADLVAGRHAVLLTRVRAGSMLQICGVIILAGLGLLLFAPDPIGRIMASLAGALVCFLGALVLMAWARAARAPAKVPDGITSFEISDDGVVMKRPEGYQRIAWKDMQHVTFARGVFAIITARAVVVIPARAMRASDVEIARAIFLAHQGELGGEGLALLPSAPAPAEQDHARDGDRDRDRDDRPAA